MVEGGDLVHAEALSDRDHRGVGGTKREIGVGLDKVGHAIKIGCSEGDECEDFIPD